MAFYFKRLPANRDDERLDKFLRRIYPEIRLSVIQKFIRSGKVIVDDKRIKDKSYRLKKGQIVLVKLSGERKQIIERYGRTISEHIPLPIKLKVIYEDDDMVVLNKPAGVSTQPGTKTSNKTIYNALLSYDTEFYLVHRLDKYTTGVLIVAKNYEFAKIISDLFHSHNIEKHYLALVYGLAKKSKEFRNPIDEKPAITIIEPKEFFNGYTLLEVETLTGRKHQIRRHLASQGMPIVGDDVYGDVPKNEEFRKRYKLKGYFLHCYEISFFYPKKQKKFTLKAPLSEERANILKLLRIQ